MCVRERERERECVCMWERERERDVTGVISTDYMKCDEKKIESL